MRAGRDIDSVGSRGDIIDNGGHIRDGYGVRAGDWGWVRPVGTIVSSDHTPSPEA
jgi:hypothetical protein